jgi:hypothetical protein
MTLAEAMEQMAEQLQIDIADGTLTEDEQRLWCKLLDEVNEEVAEKGSVTCTLTDEQLAMPVEDFVAQLRRKATAS